MTRQFWLTTIFALTFSSVTSLPTQVSSRWYIGVNAGEAKFSW